MNSVVTRAYVACEEKWKAIPSMTTEELLKEMRDLGVAAVTAEILMPRITRELETRGVVKAEMSVTDLEELIDRTLEAGEPVSTDTSGDHQKAMFRGGEGVKG